MSKMNGLNGFHRNTNGSSNGTAQQCTCGHDDHDEIALLERPAFSSSDDDEREIDTDHVSIPRSEILPALPSMSSLGYKLFDANGNTVLTAYERDEMKRLAEQKVQELFDILRIDRNDPNSCDTPNRLAKMWIDEIFKGRYEAAPKVTVFPNRKQVDELVISKGIGVMSVCSHHWQTISGTCTIGYIPGESVIGLSKLTRIADWFSRRGQIQEELGEQIAEYLNDILKPKAIGVVIRSRHYCMIARGVNSEEEKALMITTAVRGRLERDETLRREFFSLIGA
ncbi:MAG: GTP cyclohydrolase I FolE [Candidatus Kapaibacterium sp.]|nr:MAG: GTP cyclohydrolase I FolE [Candidatus Kapabacteria bacterium]